MSTLQVEAWWDGNSKLRTLTLFPEARSVRRFYRLPDGQMTVGDLVARFGVVGAVETAHACNGRELWTRDSTLEGLRKLVGGFRRSCEKAGLRKLVRFERGSDDRLRRLPERSGPTTVGQADTTTRSTVVKTSS